MNVSELNVLVDFLSYTFIQKDSGGTSAELAEHITGVWAKIEDLRGSTSPVQGQMASDVDYRVTLRFNPAFTTNWNIIYEGQVLKINHIKTTEPSYKRFMIIDCTVSLSQTSWS